ncbi:class IV adenylate cyclase [Haloglomus salinum]|jgi:adenylate cyclase class 2|uniref:class IV adenylate cyclase n=1 Tax=Haloglomus salinum TaxID=2962673 RepID=UPI0020C96D6E|nr:class IV adenylate cyclase [Haloglomus salinum]
MYEVELKVRADHDRVRERLAEVEATDAGGVTQVDTYYDAPHRDFASTDEALRLRRERPAEGGAGGERDEGGGGAVPDVDGETVTKLTYKGPLVEAESKTRREHETEVLDDDEAMAILSGLGFEPAATVEKHRRFFRYEGYTVTLDRVDGLGEFVEVEAEAEAEAVEAAREGAIAVMADLGLDPGEQIRTSYLGLLLADG